jgi:hypothetical protein
MNSARATRRWLELPWQSREIRELIGDDTALLRQGVASVGQHPDTAYQALLLIFPATPLYHPGRRRPPAVCRRAVERGLLR